MSNLEQASIKGVSWSIINVLVCQFINLILIYIFTRYIGPDEFGIFAIVSLINTFIIITVDFGLNAAFIQKQSLNYKDLNSVFWSNILIGLLMAILLYISSISIGSFFEMNELGSLLRFYCFVIILNSIGMSHIALLKKNIDFKRIAIITISSNLIAALISLPLIFKGFGIWALAWKAFITSFMLSLLAFIFSGWRPEFYMSFARIKKMLGFSAYYSLSGMYGFVITKIDEVLIGKYLSEAELGLYSNAYKFTLMPLTLIKSQVVSVLFPLFSKIQDDEGRIADASIKITSILAIIGFPVILYIMLIIPEVVSLFFTSQWSSLDNVIILLLIFAMFEITVFPGVLLLSKGKSKLYFRLIGITKLLRLILIIIGLFLNGFKGLLIGLLISSILNYIPYLYYSAKAISLDCIRLIKPNLGPLFLSLFPFILTVAIFAVTPADMNLALRVVLKSCLFVSVFILLVYFTKPAALNYVRVISRYYTNRTNELKSNYFKL